MNKPKLNQPDGESITINKTIPSKQFEDIFVIDTTNKYQELVDKATPKKVSYLNYGGYKIGNHHCPICDSIVNKRYNYCPNCGQKVDWSNENE